MARGSGLTIRFLFGEVPFLSQAARLAREGSVTGASGRNWASYGDAVDLPPGLPDWQRDLLTDPQTSGGLLVACAAERAEDILSADHCGGLSGFARIIGTVEAGAARVVVV